MQVDVYMHMYTSSLALFSLARSPCLVFVLLHSLWLSVQPALPPQNSSSSTDLPDFTSGMDFTEDIPSSDVPPPIPTQRGPKLQVTLDLNTLAPGDCVDVRDDCGFWLEGEVPVRVV